MTARNNSAALFPKTYQLGKDSISDSGRRHLLDVIKSLVTARELPDLGGMVEDVCHLLNASSLSFYTQSGPKNVIKRRLFAQMHVSDSQLPQVITPDISLWRHLNKLTVTKVHHLPEHFEFGSRVHIVAGKGNTNHKLFLVITCPPEAVPNNNILLSITPILSQTTERFQRRTQDSIQQKALGYVMDHTEEAFASWHPDGGWRFFNTPMPLRLGYNADDIKIQNVFGNKTLMSTKMWRALSAQLKACIDERQEQKCYYTLRAKNGREHDVCTTLIPKRVGKHTIVNAVTVDITEIKTLERKATQQADLEKWLAQQNKLLFKQANTAAVKSTLRALQQRFNLSRAFVGAVSDKVFRVYSQAGADITITDNYDLANLDSFSDTLVYEKIDHRQLPPAIAQLHDFSDTNAFILSPIINQEETLGIIVCEHDHEYNWGDMELRAVQMLADTLAIVLHKENIAKKLAASHKQFQMAMDAANYGLWELKIPEQQIKVSPNYYKMLGFEQPRPTDFRPIKVDNIHVDDKDTIIEQGRKLKEGILSEVDYESRHHTQGGHIKWLQTRGRVIKWDDRGKPLRAMGTTFDITELKKSQTDLQLAYQQAESARIAKGEFLARMSHEIRTPMNAIIGLTYILLQSQVSDKQRHHLNDIDKAAKTLLQIIDDILDFSKIEAGKLQIEAHNFNFRRHIKRICQRFSQLAQEKQLRFDLVVAPDVPHFVCADSTRIRQVLVSLLDNAFKFTNKGGITVTIRCRHLDRTQRELQFEVADTGIGLNTTQISTLFDPFTQADGSRTRQYGGTGLGLSIARQLIEMMHGTIEVSSRENAGSQFIFTVKCRCAKRKGAQSPAQISESQYRDDASQFNNIKVLLVEDNKVNQKVAVGMLRQFGIQTTLANNGTEAVYIMKASDRNQFDLIFMDIEMPYMGGFEATEAIRHISRHQQVPVIAMTAHLVDGDKQRYLQSGMNDCISKPIAPALLAQVLRDNVANQSLYRA